VIAVRIVRELRRRARAAAALCALASTAGAQAPDAPAPAVLEAARTAPEPRPVEVALTAGTLGVGLQLSRMVAGRVALRAGVSGAGFTVRDLSSDALGLDATLRLVRGRLVADLYPFRTAALRLTGGVVAGTARVRVRGVPQRGTFEFDGTEYPAAAGGAVDGDVTFPDVMPYVGIGFGRPRRHGLALTPVADLGVAFGRPTVALRAESADRNPALAADVEAQRRRLEDDLGAVGVYPVVTFALGWRF
jgi:opacity protein-like surface antigen